MEEGRGKGPQSGNRKDQPGGDRGGEGRPEGDDRSGRGGRRFGRRRFGRGRQNDRDGARGDAPRDPAAPVPDERASGGDRGPGRPEVRGEGPETLERTEKAERTEAPTCPLCQKPVIDLSTAMAADREAGAPAHFDCILERLTAAESLGPREKIVYLGSGSFGVVEPGERPDGAFTVKRRIQWEKEGEKKDWRRVLSTRITRI